MQVRYIPDFKLLLSTQAKEEELLGEVAVLMETKVRTGSLTKIAFQ